MTETGRSWPARALPWREIQGTEVSLPPPKELYHDSEALADVHVAPNGATCCLKRIPDRAELLAWEGPPAGPPSSWTGGPTLAVLDLLGFDGLEVYGRAQREILRIRRGDVTVVYQSAHDLGRVALSPGRGQMAWTERAERLELRTMRLANGRVARWPTVDGWCAGAAWLDEDSLLVSEVRTRRDVEVASLLSLLRPSSGVREPLVETQDWVFNRVGPAVGARVAFLSGYPHRLGGVALRWRQARAASIRHATWILAFDGGGPAAQCVANVAMGGTSAFAIDATCLFSAERHQTGQSCLLAAASATGVRTARWREPIGDFAVDRHGRRILYRTFGDRHAIMALDATELLR